MSLTSKSLGVLVLVLLFGGILVSSALGAWNTTTSKVPATYKDGEFAGQANPADIRGSYTFGDIEKAFGVPLSDLKVAFEFPSTVDPAAYQVKNLETQYATLAAQGMEVGTTSVRFFVALYKGLPFTISGDIYMPAPAVTILKQKAKLTVEQSAYLDAHNTTTAKFATPSVSQTQPPSAPVPQTTPAIPKTETTETDKTIKGKTTFNELLSWGVPKPVVEQIIAGSIPSTGMTIKDFCTQKSLDFESIKTKLQVEVDKTK